MKRWNYRAYPTAGQERAAARLFGCVRVVFNDVIAARRLQHETGQRFETATVLQSRLVAQAKRTPERAWLADVSNVPLVQAVRDADQAYRNFFASMIGKRRGRRIGAPRFKRRTSRQAARFTKNGFKVRTTAHGVGKVYLAKIGWVRFELSRDLPAGPSSVTLMRNTDGTWHVSFVVDIPVRVPVSPTRVGRSASLDLGLVHYATIAYSDGTAEKIDNPRYLRTASRRLRSAQQALSRKEGPDRRTRTKASVNWAKQRVRVARAHSRVRNARHNFHHQLAARLVRENQAVAVEALSVAGLARSGGTSAQGRGKRRSVADAGWGAFLRILQSKATEHGRTYAAVNPAYSSQTCSGCGAVDGPKPLNIREWTCRNCGARHDRDQNAAINILVAAGLAETQNACGESVSPSA